MQPDRDAILKKLGGRCAYCGRENPTHVEHRIPKDSGGTDDDRNLLPACPTCNHIKGSRDVERFRRWITEKAKDGVATGYVETACYRYLQRAYATDLSGTDEAYRNLMRAIDETPIVFYFETVEAEAVEGRT